MLATRVGASRDGRVRAAEPPVQWDPPTYRLDYDAERAAGLAHVARLLDGLCDDVGLDPAVWRDPHNAEVRRRRLHRRRHAAARELALTLGIPVFNHTDFVRITSI